MSSSHSPLVPILTPHFYRGSHSRSDPPQLFGEPSVVNCDQANICLRRLYPSADILTQRKLLDCGMVVQIREMPDPFSFNTKR